MARNADIHNGLGLVWYKLGFCGDRFQEVRPTNIEHWSRSSLQLFQTVYEFRIFMDPYLEDDGLLPMLTLKSSRYIDTTIQYTNRIRKTIGIIIYHAAKSHQEISQ